MAANGGDFNAQAEWMSDCISRAYGVPPALVGITDVTRGRMYETDQVNITDSQGSTYAQGGWISPGTVTVQAAQREYVLPAVQLTWGAGGSISFTPTVTGTYTWWSWVPSEPDADGLIPVRKWDRE
jgi:hypothetical protein